MNCTLKGNNETKEKKFFKRELENEEKNQQEKKQTYTNTKKLSSRRNVIPTRKETNIYQTFVQFFSSEIFNPHPEALSR